jgi:hypothetical protein
MLRLILALAAILVVGVSLASRLSEVHAAGNKTPIKSSTTTTKPTTTYRPTVSGKHYPKAQLYMRR